MGWEDTSCTEGTDLNLITSSQEVLRIAEDPDLHCSGTAADFSTNNVNDAYCNWIGEMVGKLNSVYLHDCNGIFIRQSKIACASQQVIPAALLTRKLYLRHYTVLAGTM